VSGDDDDREPDEPSEFRRAARDVKPLRRGSGRGERRPEPAPQLAPRAPDTGPAVFELERQGERVTGRAPGANRRLLRSLRRGEFAPERELDLHGLSARAAERAVHEALAECLAAGQRCLLLVHGRGRHSEGGPVLREALPGWLAAPPHGPRVLAFASADASHGGPGATYVLLRRKG